MAGQEPRGTNPESNSAEQFSAPQKNVGGANAVFAEHSSAGSVEKPASFSHPFAEGASPGHDPILDFNPRDLWFEFAGPGDVSVTVLGTAIQATLHVNEFEHAGINFGNAAELAQQMGIYSAQNPGFDPTTAVTMPDILLHTLHNYWDDSWFL